MGHLNLLIFISFLLHYIWCVSQNMWEILTFTERIINIGQANIFLWQVMRIPHFISISHYNSFWHWNHCLYSSHVLSLSGTIHDVQWTNHNLNWMVDVGPGSMIAEKDIAWMCFPLNWWDSVEFGSTTEHMLLQRIRPKRVGIRETVWDTSFKHDFISF